MSFDLLEQRIAATPGCKAGNGASRPAVAEAEKALGVTFPTALREYLVRFGWVEFADREFFGLGEGVPHFLDIVRLTTSERTEAGARLPPSLIPLQNDGWGNLYCIVASPGSAEDGSIVLWDHERGLAQEPEVCAPDLESWLESILDEVTVEVDKVFEGVTRTVTLERNQGLDFEARRVLPPGWRLECRADGYAFAGPWSDDWESTVWILVRFLAYKSMIALRRSGAANAMEYELVSCMEGGTGFRAVFRSFRPV